MLKLLAILPYFLPTSALAQIARSKLTPLGDALHLPEAIKLFGSTRLRYEFIDGQPRAGFNSADDLFSIRTSLALEYDGGPVDFGVEIIDSRSYFADSGTPLSTSDVNAFEINQAFARVTSKDLLGEGSSLSVTAGRQIFPVGSKRLLGAEEYRNTLNAHTGIRADAAFASGAKATLFYFLPQIKRPADFQSLLANRVAIDREGFDQQFFGAAFSLPLKSIDASAEAIALRFVERDGKNLATRDRRLSTAGLRVFRNPKPGRFAFDVEGFGQTGAISASAATIAPTLDVAAWFVHAEAGYQWAAAWKPYFSLEYDYASGDDPGGRFGRFDTIFGMRRTDLAPGGLFNAIGRANLESFGARLEATPSKRLDAMLAYRGLFLASPTDAFSTTGVRDAAGHSGDFGGHLLDARLRYWVKPDLFRLEADYVYLAKGRFLEVAPNAPSPIDTRYLSLNLTGFF